MIGVVGSFGVWSLASSAGFGFAFFNYVVVGFGFVSCGFGFDGCLFGFQLRACAAIVRL